MSAESLISRERAIELARARHDEKWRPVPGYPSGDPMATSYRMDRYESGWIFSPVVGGLDRDTKLAEHYPFYVVETPVRCGSAPTRMVVQPDADGAARA